MREEQKMIAMGRMAAGVSEELDEMVWTMEQCSGAAESRMDGMLLAGLRVLTGKAASLNGRLQSLIRQKGSTVERLAVASFIDGQLPELCKTLPSNIALAATFGDSGAEVNAGPDQLGQILADVVANAAAAMPGGGAIAIETSRVEGPQGQRFVRIAVRDNGSGLPLETAGNNFEFEPFSDAYRDKPRTHCAGLGIAAVQNTVSMLGGFLSMDTRLGAGTTIELSLPEAGADSKGADAGCPTVMVVETNAGVRRILRNLLEAQDYKLLEAEGTSQAVDMAELYDEAIDLLVLDISDVKLAVQLKKARPGMGVLFASDGGRTAPELPAASVISKPIQRSELLDQVAKMLS
jgi:CheY-like chemotaxis protein